MNEEGFKKEILDLEDKYLSPYATKNCEARRERETSHPFRGPYSRDRDHILYSGSFRRYTGKTQVIYFATSFDEQLSNRSIHTLQVSQIARTITKALRLNEDLTEAIALGHDLGHTPFGHAGEETLAKLLPDGFSHYEQSLRVVEKIEWEGKGLNLTYEVRDGIFKHSKGRGKILDDEKQNMPVTLEGQVARVSDIIAYVNHDIDDARRAEVIKEKDIPSYLIQVLGEWHASRIDRMVEDVVDASLKASLEKIAMSEKIEKAITDLRDFLYEKVYFNPQARPEIEKAEKIITDLYEYVLKNPEDYIKPYPQDDSLEKRTGDFIA